MNRNILKILIATLFSIFSFSAHTQNTYPSRPISLIVPYPPGGGVDTVARIIAPILSERLGQKVFIENKPGVSGSIGAQYVAKAPPDGYTLLLGNTTTHATNIYLTKNMGYNPTKEFVAISLIDIGPTVLLVPSNSRFNSVLDLVKELKARPGLLNYGSSGTGSVGHLAAEILLNTTKTKAQHISYKGGAPVLTDLVGGQLDFAFELIPPAQQIIQAGRLKALGVSSKTEMNALPGVKPISELGIQDYEMVTWHAIFAPIGTDAAIAQKLGSEISNIVKMPNISKKLEELGLIPDSRHNLDFHNFWISDITKWGKLVNDTSMKPE